MARKVKSLYVDWHDHNKTKLDVTWMNPYTINVDPNNRVEKEAWRHLNGYYLWTRYITVSSESFWYYNVYRYTEPVFVDKEDYSGSSEAQYKKTLDIPEEARIIQVMIRLDIDTSDMGEGLENVSWADILYGEYSPVMSDFVNWDGKYGDWITYSDLITRRKIFNIPPTPEVDLNDDNSLTMHVSFNFDLDFDVMAQTVIFQVSTSQDVSKGTIVNYYWARIHEEGNQGTAWVYNVPLQYGTKYYVRARFAPITGVIGDNHTTEWESDWSDWSEEKLTRPNAPSTIKKIRATSETSVYIECNSVKSAESYEVQWTTDKTYFDTGHPEVGSKENDFPTISCTGMETGHKYYFRIRAKNATGNSPWLDVQQTITLGEIPDRPNTWADDTTIDVGTDAVLNWVHNTKDGSTQKKAQIYIDINGTSQTKTITTSLEEDTYYTYNISTTSLSSGAIIKWKVRTKGILDSPNGGYSEWSVERQIKVYPKSMSAITYLSNTGNVINHYPIEFNCRCGPSSLTPLVATFKIVANQDFSSQAQTGEPVYVSKGDELYSKFIVLEELDNVYDFDISIMPNDLYLENGINIKCVYQVTMESGSTVESSVDLGTIFEDDSELVLYLEMAASKDDYAMLLRPYVYDISDVPEPVPEDYVPPLALEEMLNVYRYDPVKNTFILIKGNIYNTGAPVIVDPHPPLKYATYRLVSINNETGRVQWQDFQIKTSNVYFPSIVIQWDEDSRFYENADWPEGTSVESLYFGKILFLPYNIKTSENHTKDISHVEYIGRNHPVSYFGTQLGETASWTCEFDKTDNYTLTILRRLAVWTDNVYVREPSGIGYWATIEVSFNNDYDSLVIPVTLDITRVEVDKP